MTDPLAPIRRRLEKAELEHLRAHAAQLAERLENMKYERDEARDECASAWSAADHWHDQTMELTRELLALGSAVGITVDGEMGRVE